MSLASVRTLAIVSLLSITASIAQADESMWAEQDRAQQEMWEPDRGSPKDYNKDGNVNMWDDVDKSHDDFWKGDGSADRGVAVIGSSQSRKPKARKGELTLSEKREVCKTLVRVGNQDQVVSKLLTMKACLDGRFKKQNDNISFSILIRNTKGGKHTVLSGKLYDYEAGDFEALEWALDFK